jgi:hypothetical protein
MVKFYVDRIKAKKLTLEQVPARWRQAVEEALAQEEGGDGE